MTSKSRSRASYSKQDILRERSKRAKHHRERLRRERLRKQRRRRIIINRTIVLFLLVFFIVTVLRLMKFISIKGDEFNIKDLFNPAYVSKIVESKNDNRTGNNKSGDNNFDGLNINPVNVSFDDYDYVTLENEDLHKGDLVLVNDKTPLPGDFKANNLVNLFNIRKPGLFGLKNSSIYLEETAASTLNEMFSAMKSDDVGDIVIVSGHRTFDYQNNLLTQEIESYLNSGLNEQEALSRALDYVAKPGHSEHNYGYAIDVSASVNGNLLTESFEDTPQGKWLKNNSWKYGYILRYPKDKVNITGIQYEPWHFRYVGYPHSAILAKMGFCLEEYIEYVKKNKIVDAYMEDGNKYRIYYIDKNDVIYLENGESKFKVPVPKMDDNNELDDDKMTISGDGANGFIITIKL